ncbi:MAG: hypothetical protein OEV91_01155 [Desulfobulbaceae bacterium]|nr:hypothetical protein [Desulfobulbaceae bacterium]
MKRPETSGRVLLSVIFILLFPLLAGASPEEGDVGIATLAVMPFANAERALDNTMSVRDMVDCKIFGFCVWKKEEGGARTITEIYQLHLQKSMAEKILPRGEVDGVFGATPPLPHETLRTAARRLGRQARASHVLTGTVWRYRERVGGPMTVTAPASVIFTAILVRTGDGAIVWSEHFDKTQASLAENLLDAPLFFMKGMKWLSAEELADFGVEKTLRTFPGR